MNLAFQGAVAGRYALERELGRGGMGIVYLARDLRLERVVAIKLLPPERARDAGERQRFLREARTAAKLSHPHIIPIHAVEEAGEFVFFVMAFVDGETLGARLRRDGALKPHEAARVLREVAWALAYAHSQDVIHRDVKPDNILLERETGRAVVADFGIARTTTVPADTGENAVIGTPEYMSPEQAAGAFDRRSDLYALGVVGYYALSGRLPFAGSSVMALIAQHATQPPPPLDVPGAPRAILAAVARCLEKDPAARFASAETLAAALGAALEARRELPVPVRAFLAEGDSRARVGMMTPWILAALLVPGGLAFLLGQVFPGAVPEVFTYGVFAVGAILGGVAVATPFVIEGRRIHRLLAAGYTREDLLRALALDVERRREEQEYITGRGPTRFERLMRLKSWGALGLAVVTGLASFFTPYPAIQWVFGVFGLSAATAVATGIAALGARQRRLDVEGEGRLTFWEGRLGRALFRLAGIGRRRLPAGRAPGGAHRPTEVALGLAVRELFEALPAATRQALAELPEVVAALEADIGRLRRTRDDGARLRAALAALENVRLDLLRLHAGAGTVQGLTADLGAARRLGERVDALLSEPSPRASLHP